MTLKWILCLLLTITIPTLSEGIKVCSDTKSKNEICSVKEGYEKRSPPSPDTPTEVELVFNLWQVLDVDEDKQIITMSTEVDAFWKDNRLSMSNGSTLKFFSVSDLVDQLWIPEMTFPNTVKLEKAAGFEKQTLNSIQLINMPYMPNMAIINMLLIAFKCQMDFETFPFDHHHCEWQIRSYDKGINEVLFNFPSLYTIVDGTYEEVPKDETMKVNNSGLPFDVEVQALPPTEISAGGSKFSMISIQIHLKRKSKEFHKLLISYYFPTGSFGILSTFSFFVKPDVVSVPLRFLYIRRYSYKLSFLGTWKNGDVDYFFSCGDFYLWIY